MLDLKHETLSSLPTSSSTGETEEAKYNDERDCTDNPSFTFPLDNVSRSKSCSWIAKHYLKFDKRRERYCNRAHILGACLKSCDHCDCADDPSFSFSLEYSGIEVGCDWIEDNPAAVNVRRSKYCLKEDAIFATDVIGMACIRSCGFCTGGTASPTTSPSPSVSLTPTHPTESPSTSCEDDVSFAFITNIGTERDCDWISRKETRQDKYCGRGEIKGKCLETCNNCVCSDTEGFTFVANNGFTRPCKWINNQARRNKYCYENDDAQSGIASDIGSACIRSCKFCTPITELPSQMPTPVVSSKPSSGPTISPQPTLSVKPSSLPTSEPSVSPSMNISARFTVERICKSTSTLETSLKDAIASTSDYTEALGYNWVINIIDSVEVCSARRMIRSRMLQISDSSNPTMISSEPPSTSPSKAISHAPSNSPSLQPSFLPSILPSDKPSSSASQLPSSLPSSYPSSIEYVLEMEVSNTDKTLLPTEADVISSLSTHAVDIANEVEVNTGIELTVTSISLIEQPSASPSMSLVPSSKPSTSFPSSQPSNGPSKSPSPSDLPSSLPSLEPSECIDNEAWTHQVLVDGILTTMDCDNVGATEAFCTNPIYGGVVVAGVTASQACCNCGGSLRVSNSPTVISEGPSVSTSPSISPSLSIAPSDQPSLSPSECGDNTHWTHETDIGGNMETINCETIGENNSFCNTAGIGTVVVDGMTANEACCVCGATHWVSNPPSSVPSAEPSQSPSACVDYAGWSVVQSSILYECSDFTVSWQCSAITTAGSNGITVDEACCFCDGGTHKIPP